MARGWRRGVWFLSGFQTPRIFRGRDVGTRDQGLAETAGCRVYRILVGDVTEQLRTLADASVDAIVTDPPYGLEFMGKEWDAPWKTDRRQVFDGTLKMSKENPYLRSRVRSGNGAAYGADQRVMQALQEWYYSWAVEALRVLKPGGHLLAFGGSRTYHRLACAVEDAGFEIRDQIAYFYSSDLDRNRFLDSLSVEQREKFLKAFGRPPMLDWGYGSGFPKSLNVGVAIDKAGGKASPWFGPWLREERERIGMSATELADRGGFYKNINHGGLVVNWELGYGIPSAKEFNKVCEILNLPFERLEDVERQVIGQRKVHKGLAFTSEGAESLDVTAPATAAAKQWEGWGTALKPAHEPIVVARKPLIGTVAANVLEYGTGALNIDGCRVGTEERFNDSAKRNEIYGQFEGKEREGRMSVGRWPANVIHDGSEEVVSLFPQSTSGDGCVKRATGAENEGNTGAAYGAESRSAGTPMISYGDTGSAARFFYEAKPDGDDDAGGDARATADLEIGATADREVGATAGEDAGATAVSAVVGFNARPGERCGDRVYKDAGSTNFSMKPGARRAEEETPARFFYCPKADREERNIGMHGLEEKATLIGQERLKKNPMIGKAVVDIPRANTHPTVKPVDLMAYLCRLVTPPGGTVLDCFMGSGSTGIAALREGFDFIGIEIDAKYVEIARRRIEGDCPLFNAVEKREGIGNRE